MALPKKRRSYTKRHMRRSHHALKKISLVLCAQCGEPTLPHRVCGSCNMYKGKQIFATED